MRKVLLILVLATPVLAHEGVTNPTVMARMNGMSAISDATKVIGQMAKGQISFDAEKLGAAATEINRHAAEIPARFEAPEQDPKSEALPAIWDNFADFTRLAEELGVAAKTIGAVTTPDQLPPAFAALGQNCKSCHELYRK